MALTTYAELLTAVAAELHRSDLTSTIPDFVTLAESRINAKLRVRNMETVVSSTIAAGVIAVPTNYIALKDVYVSSVVPYQNLQRKMAEWIYDNYPNRAQVDTPKFIGREGSNFIFGPAATSGLVVTLRYYNRFAALSSAINSTFTAYPGIWFYGALAESAPFIKDDKRIPMWEMKFKQLVDLAQEEDDREEVSGTVLTVTAE